MTSNRSASHRCDRCGAGTPAKRMTDLGNGQTICAKCLDRIAPNVRRSLLRKAAKSHVA